MSLNAPASTDMSAIVNPRIIDASKRLIVALDVPTVEEARQIVKELGGAISFYKIGLHLQWDDDLNILIKHLIDSEKDVFIDYKYSDIGETMRGGIAGAAKRGIKFLTIQGTGEVTVQGMRAAVAGKNGAEFRKYSLSQSLPAWTTTICVKSGSKNRRKTWRLPEHVWQLRPGSME